MSLYTEYFLNTGSNVVMLELMEISHPNFTKTYRVVRNAVAGITVTLEDASQATFDYYPLKVSANSRKADLDYGFQIDLGDLGAVIPKELDSISSAGGFATKPIVKYRIYRSDLLSAPILGPLILEVGAFSFKRGGSSFEAKAPSLNMLKTGEFYTPDRFPTLNGFL